MFHGTFIFTTPPVYHWYLSVTAIFLNISWSLHNVIAWIKNKPFLSTWGSRFYITTVLLVQPYWVLEITANFLYFSNTSALFVHTRPYEALFRDPWWIFTVLSLFYEIRTRYEFGYIELMRVSPRFAVLLGAMLISIAFIIVDILDVTHVINATKLPDGVNPFWKLAFVFKCLTDTIVLDDFKTALDRLKTYRLNQMGSVLSDGVRGNFDIDVDQARQKKGTVSMPPMPDSMQDSATRTHDWSAHHVEDSTTSDDLDLEAALRMDFDEGDLIDFEPRGDALAATVSLSIIVSPQHQARCHRMAKSRVIGRGHSSTHPSRRLSSVQRLSTKSILERPVPMLEHGSHFGLYKAEDSCTSAQIVPFSISPALQHRMILADMIRSILTRLSFERGFTMSERSFRFPAQIAAAVSSVCVQTANYSITSSTASTPPDPKATKNVSEIPKAVVGKSGRAYNIQKVLQDKDISFGRVYLATNENASYILKEIPQDFDIRLSFYRRIGHHEHVRALVDTVPEQRTFVFDYLTESLLAFAKRTVPMKVRKRILKCALQDIKANNIMIQWSEDANGIQIEKVHLIDLEDTFQLPPGKGLRGMQLGNWMWRSPEAHAEGPIQKPSDLFSFGIVHLIFAVDQSELPEGIDKLAVVIERQISYFGDTDGLDGFLHYIGDKTFWHEAFRVTIDGFSEEQRPEPFRFWQGTGLDESFKSLIGGLTNFDPNRRLTAQQALDHEWFSDV
nr:hypothetical protein CFP56_60692 [Quercus suber]